jgi:hypothetical protein
MTCDRARSLDLAAFVVDPASGDFASFREHYPTCPDCSLVVADWTRLEAELRAAGGAPDPHPPVEALLSLERRPESLPDAERDALATHVAACAPCRSELRALRRFRGSGAPAPVSRARSAPPRVRGAPPRARRGRMGVLAAAAVLLALLSFAALLVRERPGRDAAPEMPVARREPQPRPALPSRSETPAPTAADPSDPRGTTIAGAEAAAPAAEPAERLTELERVPPRAGPAEAEGAPARPEPVRIALRFPAEPPVYASPGPRDAELVRLRTPSAVRAGSAPTPRIQVLAPDHVGLTQEASPTLYWTLSESTSLRVELVVTDERSEAPLVDRALDGARAGTHALSLASLGISLAPGVTYRWYATLVPDPEERTSEVVSGGAIRRVELPPALAREIAEGEPGRRAHRLAEAGLFYDALDTLARWTSEHPGAPEPRRHREALLGAVGLGQAAAGP